MLEEGRRHFKGVEKRKLLVIGCRSVLLLLPFFLSTKVYCSYVVYLLSCLPAHIQFIKLLFIISSQDNNFVLKYETRKVI